MTTAYILSVATAFIAATAVFALTEGKEIRKPVFFIILPPAAFVLCALTAKTGYILLKFRFALADGFTKTLLSLRPDTFSFYGGALGVILAVILCARCLKMPVLQTLNGFAPSGLLLCSLSRFAEGYLGNFGTGRYFDPLEEPEKCFFPLAVRNDWDEWYLAVFMLEGLVMLAMFAASLRMKREGRFLRALFYFTLPQVFCECLRTSGISWMFVRSEQVICMVAAGGVLLTECLLSGEENMVRRFLPVMIWFVSAGPIALIEYALNKSDLSYGILYPAMILVLGVLILIECRTFAKVDRWKTYA